MDTAIGKSFNSYWFTDIREIVTVKDLLSSSAALYADNPAFWVKKEKGAPYAAVSYSLLQHDVDALGTRLIDLGLSGSRVAVMGQGCYEWIVSYLSVINGTGIVVPIDKELSGPEIANLLRAGEASTIFCTSAECKKLRGLSEVERLVVMDLYGDRTNIGEEVAPPDFDEDKYRSIVMDGREAQGEVEVLSWSKLLAEGEKLLREGNTAFSGHQIDPDAMSVILFTSGTTSRPKGVMLSHRNITSNIMDVCRICNVLQSDKTLSILPIHHTYECTLGMLLVLYRGASTAFSEGLKYISQNMNEAHNTFIIAVPRVLEMVYDRIQKGIAKSGKEKLFGRMMSLNRWLRRRGINLSRRIFASVHEQLGGKLRVIITGAAALNPNLIRFYEDLGITVLQGYGMTECTPLISGTPETAAAERYRKAGSVGTVVDAGEIRLEEQDESGIGEILFKGPNVMLGYYNMPEETAAAIEPDGFMHTGDLGFIDKDGWLYLTGRKKNIIVTKTGENVYPEEIEDDIIQEPCIEECMVFPHKRDGDEIVAIQIWPMLANVTEALGHAPSEEELDAFFKKLVREYNEKLPAYKRITGVFVRRNKFVTTTTLKIRRQDNPLTEEDIIGYKKPDLGI
ncbi:MAG: AMP-binding protein [Firmicutes bacterium]|nr:AMP-binding protein [Bacillota bacterium]